MTILAYQQGPLRYLIMIDFIFMCEHSCLVTLRFPAKFVTSHGIFPEISCRICNIPWIFLRFPVKFVTSHGIFPDLPASFAAQPPFSPEVDLRSPRRAHHDASKRRPSQQWDRLSHGQHLHPGGAIFPGAGKFAVNRRETMEQRETWNIKMYHIYIYI